MKKAKLVFILTSAFLNLSFATYDQAGQRVGLLTDSYGIVTDADLGEEESRCNEIKPFPDNNGCFNYWQCLPTREMFMDCEDFGPNDDFENVGSPVFWIKDRENVHVFMTRRNFDMDACHQWLQAWKQVIENEDVVCISGNFLSRRYSDYSEEDPLIPAGVQHYWIIDRMKSRHGEWSYFYRY